jgi:vacuolar-type H+-ATPase subunit E/Vma4
MGVSLEQRSDSLYSLRLDEASPTVMYVGEASPSAALSSPVWRIKRIDTTSGVIVEWADGNSNFDNVWADRLTLSYN